jgi:hypothetical protein
MLFAIVGRHFVLPMVRVFFWLPVSRDIMIGHLECNQFLFGVGLTLICQYLLLHNVNY